MDYSRHDSDVPINIWTFLFLTTVTIISGRIGHLLSGASYMRPVIDNSKVQHVTIGGSFDLICNVTTEENTPVELTWSYPSTQTRQRAQDSVEAFYFTSDTFRYRTTQNVLTVSRVRQEDEGSYACQANVIPSGQKSNSSVFVKVYPENTASHVHLTAGEPVLHVTKGMTFQLDVEYDAFPVPSFQWTHNGIDLPRSDRYVTGVMGNVSSLKVIEAIEGHGGNYTLQASAGLSHSAVNIFVAVNEAPTIELKSNHSGGYYPENELVSFTCVVTAFPSATVTWSFQPCETTCQDGAHRLNGTWDDISYQAYTTVTAESGRKVSLHYLVSISKLGSGYLRCKGINQFDGRKWEAEETVRIIATDVENGFGVSVSPQNPVKKQQITLACRANRYDFSSLAWEWRSDEEMNFWALESGSRFQVKPEESNYSKILTVVIPSTDHDLDVNGQYRCSAKNATGHLVFSPDINIKLLDPQKPSFLPQSKDSPEQVEVSHRDTFRLDCSATGLPLPAYEWTHNGVPITQNGQPGRLKNDSSILINYKSTEDDAGVYVCHVNNIGGSLTTQWTVTVLGATSRTWLSNSWVIAGMAAGTALVVLLVILFVMCQRLKKMRSVTITTVPLKIYNESSSPNFPVSIDFTRHKSATEDSVFNSETF